MKKNPQIPGAQINPIIAVVVGIVALIAVLLLLNPPRIVDSPSTPSTPPPTSSETPVEEPDSSGGEEDTSSENGESDASGDSESVASAECAQEANLARDGTWRAEMNDETRAILEQIIESHGGLGKLNSLCTLHAVGDSELSSQGQQLDSEVEIWLRVPNQVRNLVRVPLPVPGQFIETLIIWQGTRGWTKSLNPETYQVEVSELPANLKVEAIQEITLHPVLSLIAVQDEESSFSYLGTEHEANPGAHAIQFETALGSSGIFFYDTTSLITDRLYIERGQQTIEKVFAEYANVDGFSIPHEVTTHISDPNLGQFDTVLTYESIDVNSPIESSLFTRPEVEE